MIVFHLNCQATDISCNGELDKSNSGVSQSSDGFCPDTIYISEIVASNFLFVIPGADINSIVIWDFGDGSILADDDSIYHAFMAGTYTITATFLDDDCFLEAAVTLSQELIVTTCAIELFAEEIKAGLFTITAFGYPEEYPMYWDMGDGTQIVETWVVDHFFDPGTYSVCAWYTSELCPDSVEACVEISYSPSVECTAEFTYAIDEFNDYLMFNPVEINPNISYLWTFDDGTFSEEISPTYVAESGIHEVCLSVTEEGCTDTICNDVVLTCDGIDNLLQFEGFFHDNSSAEIIVAGYNALITVVNDTVVLDSLHSSYTFYNCSPVDCFEVYVQFDDAILDSLRLEIQSPDFPELILDTLFQDNPSSPFLYITQDPCIIFGIEESESLTLQAFPNPASDIISVICTPNSHLYLYDSIGNLVNATYITSPRHSISVEELSQGIYHLALLHDHQFSSVTITVE
jgi:Secretion system C-terminal sorting domain